MKSYSILLFLLVLINCKKEQEPKFFEYTTETVDKNIVQELKQIKSWKPYGLLFQDEKYEVGIVVLENGAEQFILKINTMTKFATQVLFVPFQ